MKEWLKADILLIFVFVGLMVSACFWNIKNKKVSIRFCIAATIVIVLVLVNIIYYSMLKQI